MEMTIESALKLAIQHQEARRFSEAAAIYQQVLAASPQQSDALHLFGVLHLQLGHADAALALIDRAIAAKPMTALYFVSKGRLFHAAGRADEAIAAFQRSLELDPAQPETLHHLGLLLRGRGRLADAIECYRKSIQLNDQVMDVHHDLAVALHAAGEAEEAAAIFHKVLAADPDSIKVLNNFANLLVSTNHPVQARKLYERALALDPSRTEIYANLGNLHRSAGRAAEAIACYQRMLQAQPDSPYIHSNILLAMNCLPAADQGLLAAHQAWAAAHAARYHPAAAPQSRTRKEGQKIRIGYVSGDFRKHCVMDFFRSIITGHDRGQFEIYLYSNTARPDAVTQQLREMQLTFREIHGLPDDRAAEMIRQDGIDILIDLAGHTAEHRLQLFARKPAPVQVTYLGYPNTTGLATMDYRITDADADPQGMTDSHHTEKLIRLPGGFLCYAPPPDAPEPAERAPSDTITFGSFNNIAKVSDVTLDLWSQVLKDVPNASLMLKGDIFADPAECEIFRARFAVHGVDGSRVELISRVDSAVEHLRLYGRMDIALDTFPYHGTTTTCEALWMGVPVITLAGGAHVSRVGVSLLRRVGLDELIAENAAEYVKIAAELARDECRRREISGGAMRDRVRRSPLMDSTSFLRELEKAYASLA